MTTVSPRVLAAAERAFADARPPEGEGLSPADKFRVMLAAAITAADHARNEPPAEAPTLPTEPGSVVLARRIKDREFDPPTVAVLSDDGDSLPWWVPFGDEHDLSPARITDWIPARVVRDDDRGPAAALRNIATIQFDVYDEMTDRVDLLRAIAREALDRLDNRTQP